MTVGTGQANPKAVVTYQILAVAVELRSLQATVLLDELVDAPLKPNTAVQPQ